MVLEMPTKYEKKRFEELQKQGLLPSEALRKIETERRLGIIPEDKPSRFTITKENWWFLASIAGISAGILYIYIKSPSPTTKTASLNTDNIRDEDIYLLEFDEIEY